jgi:hypothetical protein
MFHKLTTIVMTSLITLCSFVSAQDIVGTWSSPIVDSQGNTTAVIFMTFGADGSFQEYLTTNMGASTYYGSYQMDAAQAAVSFVLQDYEPKEFCSSVGCSPLPPSLPLGQSMTLPIQWQSPNLFIGMDASGPMRFIRQR